MEPELTLEDREHISYAVRDMKYVIGLIDQVRQFKSGDYLICVHISNDTGQRVPSKNSYGAILKWKVIYVDELGLPHVKLINNKGKPHGALRSLVSTYSEEEWTIPGHDDYAFELDPDYVEAIILQQQESYDPVSRHNTLKLARQETTDFNKSIKMPTSSMEEVVDTFAKLQVGITYWTSHKRGFTVLENNICTLKQKTTYIGNKRVRYPSGQIIINKIKVRHSNGKIKTYEPADMKNKNIYTGIPKSYNDKSDSI
jgi:hypothetical protein